MDIAEILYPTDFGPGATGAFDAAVSLACALRARLRIVHVLHEPVATVLDPSTYVSPSPEQVADLRRAAAAQMRALASAAAERGVEVATVLEPGGAPAERLVEETRRHGVGLVILGTRRRAGPTRRLVGSVELELSRRASCPVLVVREDPSRASLALPQRILVAFDFSPLARQALEWVGRIAARIGATIELLYAAEEIALLAAAHDGGRNLRRWRRDELHRLEAHLREIADSLAYGVPTDVVVLPGRPADIVQQRLAAGEVDWVAVGTHGHSTMKRLLYGSTSAEVLAETDVPVLTVGPACTLFEEAGGSRRLARAV